jgi:hypothetical protein
MARPAGQRERRARRHRVQPRLGVERLRQAEQVTLVGAAAVMEHEQARRLRCGGPLGVGERAHATRRWNVRIEPNCASNYFLTSLKKVLSSPLAFCCW